MALPDAYDEFLDSHQDGDQVFDFSGVQYRLVTRGELQARVDVHGMELPFISCLVGYRRNLVSYGLAEEDLAPISGIAIGEYSGDITFISHQTDAVCTYYDDGSGSVEEIAPSVDEFLAGLEVHA